MNIKIQGKGIEVSEYLKETVEKKAKKLDRYFKPQTQMNVMLSIEKLRQIAEVTIICDGLVLRCEEATGDMYASIDASLKKLERQMRKHRTKLERRLHTGAFDEGAVYEQAETDAKEPKLIRSKRFTVKPMDIDEAMLQMELVGHDFFVFRNAVTGEVNVLYKRKDGDLGLIEPDIE